LGQTKGISTQRERERDTHRDRRANQKKKYQRERERDERVFSVVVKHRGVSTEDKN
jgi:hypothetical protein